MKSASEILIEMCDAFDSYIAPKAIERSDENFIYLLLKAIAKGYERVSSLISGVNNKFDPAVCSDKDLYSTARLVGTDFLEGKGSGLVIVAENTGEEAVSLNPGEYVYNHTEEAVFRFTVLSEVSILPGAQVQYAAFTDAKGSFPVDSISDLPVVRSDEGEISGDITFSCGSNELMLGYGDETPIDFRRRILSDTDRQDAISELELEIRNLPYILDCKLTFNHTLDTVTVDGIAIPSFHILVALNGDAREEIARIVARKTTFPTVMVDGDDVLFFENPIFVGGKYPVYFTRFTPSLYSVRIRYRYNERLITESIIESSITQALNKYKLTSRFTPLLTERTFYEELFALALPSVSILDVDLVVDSTDVSYVEALPTKILRLDDIVFIPETL